MQATRPMSQEEYERLCQSVGLCEPIAVVPSPAARKRLLEGLGESLADLARVLGERPMTVGDWLEQDPLEVSPRTQDFRRLLNYAASFYRAPTPYHEANPHTPRMPRQQEYIVA